MAQIGRSVKRIEDRPLLTGAGRFAADLAVADMLHMRVVRSAVAFGCLTSISTEAARAHPGCVAVWTAADTADIPPIGFRLTPVPGLEPYRQPVLARDYVRYVGEPLAIVFADDPYAAEDLGDLVAPEIEPLMPCAAALRLHRPVKWIEDRYEHLVAANQSRGQVNRVRAAVDERGFILGLDDEFWFDQGAYIRTHGVTVPDLTAAMLPGPYIVPAYRSVGHVRLTNKTPCGTYRAPGRFEGSFVRERLLDAIADRLGLDPIAARRVNLIPKTAMPFSRD